MALTIKSLAKGAVPTTQTAVYTVPAGKAALVKSMRYVFNSTSGSATVNAFFRRGASGTAYRILDKDKNFGVGGPTVLSLVDNDELALEADDRIELVASAGTVDYAISGIERDQ
jgi:hypothetical protein